MNRSTFTCGSAGKESTCKVGDGGSIPELGRSSPVFWPEERHGLCRPWGCTESDVTDPLSLTTFTGASLLAQMVKNLPAMQEIWVRSLDWEDSPGEGNTNPLQYACPGEFHGQRSLAVYGPWGGKESNTTKRPTLPLSFCFCFKNNRKNKNTNTFIYSFQRTLKF